MSIKHRESQKKRISPEARRLILTIRRKCGSDRETARRLGLANHAQVGRMLRGEMAETPAMRAAVARAKARAKDAARRAFIWEKPETTTVEVEQLRKKLGETIDDLICMRKMIS